MRGVKFRTSRDGDVAYARPMPDRASLISLLERRALTIAAIAFVVGAVLFFGYVGTVGWGLPGTTAYEQYERANRILAAPLLVHLAGWLLALRAQPRGATLAGVIGAAMLIAGNVGEFWFFSSEPYTSSARLLSWTSFMFGALLTLPAFALLAMGRAGRRSTA